MSVSDWVWSGVVLAFAGYLIPWRELPMPWGLLAHRQRPAKPDKAVVRRAAEAGYVEATADLGHQYARGRRHAARAERYLRLAADSGDFSAQQALGRILMESGRQEEGGRYFRLAVDQEDAAVFNARVFDMDRAGPNVDIDSFDGDVD